MSLRLRSALAGLACMLSASSAARADTPPSRWMRASEPDAADAYDLHRLVQQQLAVTSLIEMDLGERERVLSMLQRAGAERSPHALLRFDLGYVYLLLEDHPRARDVYQSAIAAFPTHPAVEEAWFRLAVACGHVGDHACERDAYVNVLRLATEEVLRATPTLNLAEVEMHAGELTEAIEGYREALRLAARVPGGETTTLATWGLAVALDRAGERAAAEREARFALELERSSGLVGLLRSRGVFFYPPHEIHWYEGLGYAASAAVTSLPNEAILLWLRAERSFAEYVRASSSVSDPWHAMAKVRLAHVKSQRTRVERQMRASRPERAAQEEASP